MAEAAERRSMVAGRLAEVDSPARVYGLYGLRIASRSPLRLDSLPLPAAAADLTISVAGAPPPGGAAAPAEILWDSPEPGPRGGPATRLERRGPWWRLSFEAIGDFWIGAARVVVVPVVGAAAELVELRLLGPVLAFCLELRGVVTLHASAVVLGGRGVAVLAPHGGGKSSLAATLMQQGASLLSDDLLALEVAEGGVRGRPGLPEMRMWPDAARLFTGDAERWPRVVPWLGKRRVAVSDDGFGRFQPEPRHLHSFWVPGRRNDQCRLRLERIPPSGALLELVRGSYLPRVLTAAGLQPRRLAILAELVETVPVFRLEYPSGYERLNGIGDELRRNIELLES